MRRNFTGSSLACLLFAVIAMKQVALGFCLCDASYFVDSCECHEATPADVCQAGCCGDHHEDSEEAPAPCDDCETSISLDTGDFLWAPLDDLSPNIEVSDLPAPLTSFKAVLGHSLQSTVSPRGSPPPDSCALFLRYQSLRL